MVTGNNLTNVEPRGIYLLSTSPIIITDCWVGRYRIHNKILKGFTKRFIVKCKYQL